MQAWPATVLITGATQGLGLATARLLAMSGTRVILHGRSSSALKEAVSSLAISKHGPHLLFDASFERADFPVRLVLFLEKAKVISIDWLVHSAGLNHNGEILKTKGDSMRAVFEVNTFSVVPLAQVLLPFLERSAAPRFILVSSLMRHLPLAGRGTYSASKAAAEHLFESLALESEVCGYKTRFQILRPASFNTDFHDNGLTDSYSPRSNVSRMSAEAMAEHVVALGRSCRRARSPGFENKVIAFIARHFKRLTWQLMKRRYRRQRAAR